jgi:hypothetical protein
MSQETDSEAVNPYASPQSFPAVATSPGGSPSPVYELYSVGAIVLATFFGSLFAGGLLMSLDYRRLENLGAARLCLIVGAICQILFFGLAFLLPDNIPTLAVLAPQLFVMYLVAEQRLAPKLRAHEKARGKYASLWKAAGIGLACCLVELVLIFTLVFVLALTGVTSH